MSVESVLEKISDHNSDILGCVATHGERVHHNLPGIYEMLDARALGEYATNMFAVMEELQPENPEFTQIFIEYQGHSVFAKRLDDGVLALVNKPIQRSLFKKMQVGVNLFVKPLKKALDAPDVPSATPETPAAPKTAPRKRRFLYRGVEH